LDNLIFISKLLVTNRLEMLYFIKIGIYEEEIRMAIVHATDQNFSTETGEGVVLADFWATWCGPCKMIAPVLEEIDDEMSDKVKVVKLDVDENQETAGKFGVMSIPTLLLFKDGEVVDQVVGFQPKEALVELISKHA
jgi:thioredoxin 1